MSTVNRAPACTPVQSEFRLRRKLELIAHRFQDGGSTR